MSDKHVMFVKTCGLRDVDSARVAVEAGSDALGFILAESRRKIAASVVADIRRSLLSHADHLPPMVGVTVNAGAEQIERFVDEGSLDMIQLSGDEDLSILGSIDVPVIKSLRFPSGTLLNDALRGVDAWLSAAKPVVRVIVEGHADGSYGGTGTRADWEYVAHIAERYPIVLAGGLTPQNVAAAIHAVQPSGVDVSSGTETDGVKDHAKIRAFAENARVAVHQSLSRME